MTKRVTIGEYRGDDTGAATIDVPSLIESRALIQANSGGGKSNAIRLLAELVAPTVQTIIIDREGEFPTLRASIDLLWVGADGELKATPRNAGDLAMKLAECGANAVIDLFGLPPAVQRSYVRSFVENLYAMPKRLWGPRLIMIDEAHLFCPEKSAGEAESTNAIIDLMSGGRKRGLCGVLATQRISKLNKDAAADANNKLIGRASLDVDYKRAGDELGMGREDRIKLRDLEKGDFYALGPAFGFKGVRFLHLDKASSPPPASKGHQQRRVSAPSEAIRKLLPGLEAIAAAANPDDVHTIEAAQARIRSLRNELAAATRGAPKSKAPAAAKPDPAAGDAMRRLKAEAAQLRRAVEEVVKFIVNIQTRDFKDADPAAIEKAISAAVYQATKNIETLLASRAGEIRRLRADAQRIAERLGTLTAETKHQLDLTVKPQQPFAVATAGPRRPPAAVAGGGTGDIGDVAGGERSVLIACAQHPEGCTREQIGVLTGYKRSTRDTYIQRLAARGFLAVNATITATEAGVAALGDFQALPTGDALREYWLARLPDGEAKVLSSVISHWPSDVGRDAISEATGYKRSTRDTYLQRLAARRLVDVSAGGGIVASNMLFSQGGAS